MCPNLVDLEVNVSVLMDDCGKPWPSLRRLAVLENLSMDKTALIALIERNPQLTCIEFTDDPRDNITLAVSKLFLLEKVTISCEALIGFDIACLKYLT